MILVTGGTGFVGNHLVRHLAARGERLRLLVRPSSDLSTVRDYGAEVAVGDLLDIDSLLRAARGCSAVFHVAAEYSLWSRDPSRLYRSNVDGTRNMLRAARRAGVRRLVHTSSVGTICPPANGAPVTEMSPSTLAGMVGHYKRSKLLAERAAMDAAARGQDVVVVNPTAPIGERDFKPTPTGRIVLDFLRGRMPAYVDTGLNLVDVRDVARGHWLALTRGRSGHRYLLGSENISLRRMLSILAQLSGRPAPRLRIPHAAAWVAGAACEAWSRLLGQPPAVPMEGVRMARKRMYADCSKAQQELSYSPAPVEPALARAVAWFQGRPKP